VNKTFIAGKAQRRRGKYLKQPFLGIVKMNRRIIQILCVFALLWWGQHMTRQKIRLTAMTTAAG